MKEENIVDTIIAKLQPLGLERVILFGSYANGSATPQSDIDLYVVTKDEYIPYSFKERSELTKKISKKLREIRSHTPLDLIVHTKKMAQSFKNLESAFSKEIWQNGKILI